MRMRLLTGLLAIGFAPALAAQSLDQGLADYRADPLSWYNCAIVAGAIAAVSSDPLIKASRDAEAEHALISGVKLAMAKGTSRDAAFETFKGMAKVKGELLLSQPGLIQAELLTCAMSEILSPDGKKAPPAVAAARPSPAPAPAAAAAAGTPMYSVALGDANVGGAISYRIGPGGRLDGRYVWKQNGEIASETATPRGTPGPKLTGSYDTAGRYSGGTYRGVLTLTYRGVQAGTDIGLYDLAWDNGDRGYAIHENNRLHGVFGGSITGVLTPNPAGTGWDLIWIGLGGQGGNTVGSASWTGPLTGTHQARPYDQPQGQPFAIKVGEGSSGTLRFQLPGGLVGLAVASPN